jgi:hypothetical protein
MRALETTAAPNPGIVQRYLMRKALLDHHDKFCQKKCFGDQYSWLGIYTGSLDGT